MNEVSTTRATDTRTTCPHWCTLDPGHAYDVEDGRGRPSREHVRTAARWEQSYANISADGRYPGWGKADAVTEPRLDVVIDLPSEPTNYVDGLTAAQARELAGTLNRAADEMDKMVAEDERGSRLVAVVAGNVARALEAAGMTPEDVAEDSGVPVEALTSGLLNIDDVYMIATAVGALDTFSEWFREPETAGAS
jgi:hypothetical protein